MTCPGSATFCRPLGGTTRQAFHLDRTSFRSLQFFQCFCCRLRNEVSGHHRINLENDFFVTV